MQFKQVKRSSLIAKREILCKIADFMQKIFLQIKRKIQGYIFLQIPYFLGRETIQPKLKLGKKFRWEQWKCVHDEMGKKFNAVVK